MHFTAIICISMKLRQNWRQEVAHLPVHRRFAAFTLIEFSIVLVVIGLLVGGVLVGQDMIEAAQIRNQISQLTDIETAMYTYKAKYNALPGDHKSASTFGFGSNGNGNKTIDIWANEAVGFWEHLKVSGLFLHDQNSGATPAIGLNTSKLYPYSCSLYSSYGTTFPNSAICINIAKQNGPSISAAALTVHQAWSMDTKLDNGLPYNGAKFLSTGWGSSSGSEPCPTDLFVDNSYNLAIKNIVACRSIYVLWKN